MGRHALLALLVTLTACSKKAPPAEARPAKGAQVTASTPVTHHGLAWYTDAPEAALEAARAADKLVLVDLWAYWCHTCLSMREYVLTAEHLAGVRDRLVFLAIDTERARNAKVLERLPIAAWPTFYLVDADYAVHGRLVGAASPAQLTLEAQLAAYRALPAGQKQPAREDAVQKRLADFR